jgi:hypothetical protein
MASATIAASDGDGPKRAAKIIGSITNKPRKTAQ